MSLGRRGNPVWKNGAVDGWVGRLDCLVARQGGRNPGDHRSSGFLACLLETHLPQAEGLESRGERTRPCCRFNPSASHDKSHRVMTRAQPIADEYAEPSVAGLTTRQSRRLPVRDTINVRKRVQTTRREGCREQWRESRKVTLF